MNQHMNTTLGQDALQMALGRHSPAVGFMRHSDRGSQYARHTYQAILADHGIVCSMSEKDECLANAVAERFFSSLKREWILHSYGAMRQEAMDEIIDYNEMFYNSRRKHSHLMYVNSDQYEQLVLVA